ncbi:hypothetical protein HanHA89_Chr12g0470401 [Helianthus annuus]|nr:hypothetical protein HanHA89_Chr12g0470401 [Helianthus annuus]
MIIRLEGMVTSHPWRTIRHVGATSESSQEWPIPQKWRVWEDGPSHIPPHHFYVFFIFLIFYFF